MLVERCSIESGETVIVAWEVGGHPVEQHADAVQVTVVHKILKIVGCPEPAGWRVVSEDLISPGLIEGVFGDGHQLEMREPHLLCVVYELVGEISLSLMLG